jgi:F-type H+-transporting ATPase subunit a
MTLKNTVKSIFLALATILCVNTSFANETHEISSEKHEEKPFNVNDMIMHHIKDAHEWHLFGSEEKGNAVSIYLPIILVDGGLKVFSSSNFYHGEHKAATDHKTHESLHYVAGVGPAEGYAMFHEKIYKLKNGELHFEEGHPHGAEMPFDMSITKNVMSLFFGAIFILVIMSIVARFYKKNGPVAPKGLAKYLEVLVVMVRDNVAKENIGEKKYEKYVPYLLTVFFFIFFNNLLGMIPFLPGGANLTGNISVTLFLAFGTLLITLFSSNGNYWKHIFATPGVPVALLPIMIPIEIVGIFTKPFALMIRLFANMAAGHIIILALIGIIFINGNAAWGAMSVPMALFISVLELLVAFLQAFLFVMLSALFIGAAVEEAHH